MQIWKKVVGNVICETSISDKDRIIDNVLESIGSISYLLTLMSEVE